MHTKKIYFVLSIILTFLLITSGLTGCGSTKSSNGVKTLNFVWFSDGNEGKVMSEIAKEYEASHKNIKINMIEVPFNDEISKIKTMISGGDPPALARIASANIGDVSNYAVDLSPYVGGINSFSSQFVDSIKPYYIKGNKIIAAPSDVTINALIYNKTLFDKAKVSVPTSPDNIWTWDQFEQSIKKVLTYGGAKVGLVWDVTPFRWSTILYEFGGSIFNSDGTKCIINDSNGVAALNYFIKLHQDGVMPKSVWLGGDNPNDLFRSGQAAADLAGNWVLTSYKDIKDFEWGVTYLPKGIIRSSVPGGKFLMAFKGSGVEKEAADFIKYLSSKEVNSRYCKENLFMSPRTDSQNLNYSYGNEFFKIFEDELKNSSVKASNDWARTNITSKMQLDLKKAITDTLQGNSTPKQALDKVADITNKIIEEQGK